MKRQELINQVKEGYASIASQKSQQNFHKTGVETPEAYYERLLGAVITQIQNGTFDNARSGTEIINKVAADKSILSLWS
jgi:hypothetical protein